MSAAAGRLRHELETILRRVRRRWRLRRALLGAVGFLAVGACIGIAAALAVDAWRFAPDAVAIARTSGYLLLAIALALFVGLPVFQRVSDRRIALYVEEREPSLKMALVSATEIGDGRSDGTSPSLERGLLQRTVLACQRLEGGRRVDGARIRRNALLLAASAAIVFLVAGSLPENVRQAFKLVFFPTPSVAAVNPYALTAEPGDVLISRGAD